MIELVPMNDQEFVQFREFSKREFAQEKIAAGEWKQEEAEERAEESFQRYLPNGQHTEGAFIYHICNSQNQQHVGYLWLNVMDAPAGRMAFIYDIMVYEQYQGKGYGQQTMQALEQVAREQGAKRIGLHVFGHNDRALHVYQKAGYVITDYQMSKTL